MRALLLFSIVVSVSTLGCGKAYQSITSNDLNRQLESYDRQRLSVAGIPAEAQRRDFLPPTPLREGQWTLIINGIKCTQIVNFENEPRIRSMVQIATLAQQQQRPIKVSGVVKDGRLEMEFFEEIRTDTAWYKDKNPYYSYGDYYEWYPFAYSPNTLVMEAIGRQ